MSSCLFLWPLKFLICLFMFGLLPWLTGFIFQYIFFPPKSTLSFSRLSKFDGRRVMSVFLASKSYRGVVSCSVLTGRMHTHSISLLSSNQLYIFLSCWKCHLPPLCLFFWPPKHNTKSTYVWAGFLTEWIYAWYISRQTDYISFSAVKKIKGVIPCLFSGLQNAVKSPHV